LREQGGVFLQDIEEALLKMDKDGSGEVEQEEFAQWFRDEHADEHPAGPDVFLVTDRLEEMFRCGNASCLLPFLSSTESFARTGSRVSHIRIVEKMCCLCICRRQALPRPSAGDRDLGLEIAVAMFGRCVDLLQFKRVVHFFANKERDGLYKRLGPLNGAENGIFF